MLLMLAGVCRVKHLLPTLVGTQVEDRSSFRITDKPTLYSLIWKCPPSKNLHRSHRFGLRPFTLSFGIVLHWRPRRIVARIRPCSLNLTILDFAPYHKTSSATINLSGKFLDRFTRCRLLATVV